MVARERARHARLLRRHACPRSSWTTVMDHPAGTVTSPSPISKVRRGSSPPQPPHSLRQVTVGYSTSMLTGGARDLPERQRTLRATIEWTYDLLAADRAAAVRSSGRLPRRLHARSCRSDRRRNRGYPAVTRRQEPRPPHTGPLLDPRNHPRVRDGASRKIRRSRECFPTSRRLLPRLRRKRRERRLALVT
jgi:hypothetical protein